ncbi:unnamed protein product, partial [Tenebrio molitor]
AKTLYCQIRHWWLSSSPWSRYPPRVSSRRFCLTGRHPNLRWNDSCNIVTSSDDTIVKLNLLTMKSDGIIFET